MHRSRAARYFLQLSNSAGNTTDHNNSTNNRSVRSSHCRVIDESDDDGK